MLDWDGVFDVNQDLWQLLEDNRKACVMTNAKLLRNLIKSGAEGNLDAFRHASQEVIRQEREKKHHLLANDLEMILYGRAAPTVL